MQEHDHNHDYQHVYHSEGSDGIGNARVPRRFAIIFASDEDDGPRDRAPSLDPYDTVAQGLLFAGSAVVSRYHPKTGLEPPEVFSSTEHARQLLSHSYHGNLETIWI